MGLQNPPRRVRYPGGLLEEGEQRALHLGVGHSQRHSSPVGRGSLNDKTILKNSVHVSLAEQQTREVQTLVPARASGCKSRGRHLTAKCRLRLHLRKLCQPLNTGCARHRHSSLVATFPWANSKAVRLRPGIFSVQIREGTSRFPSTISSCAGFRTQRFRVQLPGEA